MPHGTRHAREPGASREALEKGQFNMGSRFDTIGRSACAAALSCVLALSPALAGAEAWADTPEPEKTSRGGASQLDSAAAGGDSGAEGSQVTETVKLPEASGQQPSEPSVEPEGSAPSSEGQASAEAPLIDEKPKPVTGEVRADGLVYRVLPDGASVALAGWYGEAPSGDVSVPASVSSGSDSFSVTAIGVPGADGSSEGVFSEAPATSLSVPASVESIADGALSGCPTLARVSVSSDNETYASFDGMLFSKDLSCLLLVPEGKEGAALLPDPASSVPAGAFSRAPGLPAVRVGQGCAAFSSRDGILYTKDMKALVACPPGAGDAVVIPEGVESIGSGAFAGCAVASVTALGHVREIAADAFDAEARADAVVALPAGDDYEARKAAWKAAGFEKFKEPARPGDVSAPEPSEPDAPQASGLAYEVLGDYTLAVSWQGAEGPEGTLEIPATAEVGGVSYRVSAVADAAFAGCSDLAGVTLPASVTSIGERAFEATGISDAWLPASVATVGERAFAACPSLERIVVLGSPWVADSAIAECSGVSVYAPSESPNPWNVGLPAAGNHLMPYGVSLAEEPLQLEVGQSASILEDGKLEAPDPIEVSYSYAAKPLSVDPDGTATGKAEGSSEVTVTLTLDGVQLASASRTVEVAAAPDPEPAPEASEPEPEAEPAAESLSLEPRLSARGVEVLSGEVSLLAETRIFDYEYEGSNLRYQVTKEPSGDTPGNCTVMGRSYSVTDLEGNLVIPEIAVDAANGNAKYYVTSTANYAFGNMGIETVSLPQSLTRLGQGCFQDCSNLRSVVLPQSVSYIGFNPFIRCKVLSDIRVEEGSKYFSAQDGILYNKSKTMLYGGTPASIVGQLDIPDTVTRVRVNAFSGCTQITGMHIPKSVSNFGDGYNIIGGLEGLKDLTIDPENPYYAVEDGLLYKKENDVPVSLLGGTPASSPAEPRIPATVTRLDKSAFRDRLNLQAIELPPAATYYGAYLFQKDVNLSTVASLGGGSVEFDTALFSQCSGLTELIVASSDPVFTNTEGPSGNHFQFEHVDTRNVTLHCPESAREAWAEFGLNVVPFSTGVPGVIGLPEGGSASTCSFEPSISTDSAFVDKVRLVHAFKPGNSEIAADLSDPTGRSIAFFPGSGSGSATLTTKLVYDSDLYGQVVLAESASTVMPAPRSGALPTATDAGNTDEAKASWSLSDDGVLTVRGTEKIGDFGWSYGDEASNTQHWGSLRDCVTKVDTRSLAGGASSMASWFSDMPRLSDVGDLVVPEGVEDASDLLRNCAVAGLPEGFELPDSLRNADGLLALNPLKSLPDSFAASFSSSANLASCRSMLERTDIERLPDGFALPSSVSDVSYLFASSKLAELPEGFTVPGTVSTADGLFRGCASLVRLSAEFALGEGVASAVQLFDGCISLASLPEKLTVPSSLSSPAKCAKMLGNCPKLQVLPAAFALPKGFDLAAVPDMFYCYTNTPLAYAGSDAALLGASQQYWTSQRRVFDTTQAGSVVFKLQDASSGVSEVWASMMPNAANGTIMNPEAPHRTGKVFTLWYADEACTKRFDFTKRVADQLAVGPDGTYALYGAYVDGTREGSLPTVGNEGWASWSLSDDGTLCIRGTGAVNLDIPDAGVADDAYAWSPYRADVRKVSMQPALKAALMRNWFSGMKSLEDVSEAFVPSGVKNMHRAFDGCESIASLPEGFSILSSVENLASAFGGCSSLASLPSSFVLGGESLTNMSGAFRGCTSLASLPEGFSIPASVQYLDMAFRDCPSLTRLPNGFSLPGDALEAAEVFLVDASAGSARIPTYYGGDDQVVLGYDWESDGRTLVTDAGDMGEWGMRQVKLRLQSADEAAGFPWETRSTAWTDRQGMLTDPGEPQLEGYRFSGWCVDEECLKPVDFKKPLPAGADALYGKWLIAGAKNAADRAGGELPCEDADGNPLDSTAWWRIVADGTLEVKGEGKISDLEFWWSADDSPRVHWEPHRDRVARVQMDRSVEAVSMANWFCRMPGLVDASGVFVPEGCENVAALFYGDGALATLPDDLVMPRSVTNAASFMQGCTSVASLPVSFGLSEELLYAGGMFLGCGSLESLPEKFTVTGAVQEMSSMFEGCSSLSSLPEGFSIPVSVMAMDRAFYGCNALASLPASFDFPKTVADAADSPFLYTGSSGTLDTYFAGDPTGASSVNGYDWASQNRKLVVDVPAGKLLVEFNLPETGSQTQGQAPWSHMLAAVDVAFSVPAAPVRAGFGFAGWFIDPQCTASYDFSKTPAENGVSSGGTLSLYAKYAAKKGDLPTTDGGQNASWELDADGTLRISCEPDATIKSLGWDPDNVSGSYEGTWNDQHWGFVRDEVRRIEMASGVKAEDMICWFAEMHNLEDVSGAYVPEGVEEINRLFFRCTSLEAIPDGFELPEGVVSASDAFAYCSNLKTLPSGFTLPSTLKNAGFLFDTCRSLETIPPSCALPNGLQNATGMFGGCVSLKSLPSGFAVPDTVVSINTMFVGCSSLEALPAGFALPGSVTDVSDLFRECASLDLLPAGFTLPNGVKSAARMFRGCTSLSSLPESFSVPETIEDVSQMFRNCTRLTWLPASLALSCVSGVSGAETMFDFTGEFSFEHGLRTYYAGSDLAKLSIDGTDAAAYWLKNFHRTLATSADKPDTVKEVSFVVADPTTGENKAWTTVGVEGGVFSRPADPARFGYAFDGWYENPAFSPASRVAFGEDGTAKVDRDLALYGRYVLRVSYDIPVAAKVTIDASGDVEPAPVAFRSFTPELLLLKSVAAAEAPGAAKLFPVEAERGGIEVLVGVGTRASRVPLGGSERYLGELPAAEPTAPGEVEGSLSFDRHGAQIDYQPGDDITSFAKLEWTVEVAS